MHMSMPESMLSVVLLPVIKDKAGKISSKDNYRPIALASVISKLVEVIMLDRIEMYMNTNPNQFAFKRKHGTDQCIYVLKEIIDLYRRLNGIMAVSLYVSWMLLKLKCGQYPEIHTSYIISQSTTL